MTPTAGPRQPRRRSLLLPTSRAEPLDARPLLSVVIPAHRRPAALQRCLAALATQRLPRAAFEVIVCDDGSPDPLAPHLEEFAGRLTLTVLRQPNAGPAAARNAGARQARGAYLAFTDDDCAPAEDWLARLAERIERHPGHLIGGGIVNDLPHDRYAVASQLVGDAVVDHYERHGVVERFYSTSNLTVPADEFRRIGGFDERFTEAAGEDYDLCARWHRAALPSVYAPEAVVRHAHAHTAGSFWRQHFGYGQALLRMRRRMARRERRPLRLEAPRFYAHLVTYPLRRGLGMRGVGLAALVLLSQIAAAAGGLRGLLRGGADGDEPADAAAGSGVGPEPGR